MSTPRKVRWLIAHQPQELFVRTARAFSEELAKLCGNELDIEILTYPEYRERYCAIPNLEILDQADVDIEDAIKSFWDALFDSNIEMSQIQVGQVGELYSDFHALDMPFMFEDHDHVSRTLEGPIGQELCHNLGQRTGVTGLAFTYSGGFRVIGSNDPILTLDELRNKRIVVQNPITLGTTIESMGGQAVPVPPNLWNKYDLLGKGEADAVETTYLRFNGKHVLKTNHSMFMTTIVISNKFWETLTQKQQQAFRAAALVASRREREWSIEDSNKFESSARANGVTITDISEHDKQALKHRSQITYVKSKHYFSPGLIKRIRETKH